MMVHSLAHDHAALELGLARPHEATGNPHWLERAAHWGNLLLVDFGDKTPGEVFPNAPRRRAP